MSLRKISSHLKHISTTTAPSLRASGDDTHRGGGSRRGSNKGKSEGSTRGAGPPRVQQASARSGDGTESAVQQGRIIDSSAVVFLQPTAPLWLPGLDYEVGGLSAPVGEECSSSIAARGKQAMAETDVHRAPPAHKEDRSQ